MCLKNGRLSYTLDIKKRRGVSPSFSCLNTANSGNLYTLFTFSCQSSFASPPLAIDRFDLFYRHLVN